MQYLASLLLLAATAQAHYHFPRLVVNGAAEAADWGHVRKAKNWQSNGFVGDVSSADIRCNELTTQAAVSTVAAGGSVGFTAAPSVYHPGPLQFYMAKVPAGQSIDTWDAPGNVWFKVYSDKPIVGNSGISWPNNQKSTLSFTVPKSTPSGDYIVRIEHIALHSASAVGGAQFYIACGHITVTGGGSGSPGPLVSFPGAYKATDPGIQVNINYPVPTNYQAPGPAVWTG